MGSVVKLSYLELQHIAQKIADPLHGVMDAFERYTRKIMPR